MTVRGVGVGPPLWPGRKHPEKPRHHAPNTRSICGDPRRSGNRKTNVTDGREDLTSRPRLIPDDESPRRIRSILATPGDGEGLLRGATAGGAAEPQSAVVPAWGPVNLVRERMLADDAVKE